MSKYYDDPWWHYTPAEPLPVQGGIRAKSQRGGFGGTWWGRKWVRTLESFNIGARLGRGKSYARGGQVADLVIGAGEVRARVQGTRRTPYKVSIRLRAFTAEEWQGIVRRLRRMPIEVAALLRGEMPEALDAIVAEKGLSLFPRTDSDLITDCSCPDWSNPCKHIAAVYYLLAEAFDDDPFLLLRLRGMDRAQLLSQLQTAAVRRVAEAPPRQQGPPLPADPEQFWSRSDALASPLPSDIDPAASIISALGAPSFWRAARPFAETLAGIHRQAAATAEEFTAFWEQSQSE
ncbi:MAG: SWIM zinc finger family protein [Bacteroidetes bacterium]|nr:SWIM zinc finger family protein [Bacteroidota bacterium]